MSKKSRAVGAGVTTSAATGGAMIAATASLTGPAANLGGYVVAQTVASSVGLGGPAVSAGIAALGGPVVVGGAIAVGLGYGVYKLIDWLTD